MFGNSYSLSLISLSYSVDKIWSMFPFNSIDVEVDTKRDEVVCCNIPVLGLCYLLWFCGPFVLQLIFKNHVFFVQRPRVLTKFTKRSSVLLFSIQNKHTETIFFHLRYNCRCYLFKNSSGQCELVYSDFVSLVLTLIFY